MLADDPDLWKPGPPPEDCPVCMIPLPIRNGESIYYPCCGKLICRGCVHESRRAVRIINSKRAKKEQPPVEEVCVFCRLPMGDDRDDAKRMVLRMEKDDCKAYFKMACDYRDGIDGLPKDESKTLELYVRAAELGSTAAMAFLGRVYESGKLGVIQDLDKAREFYIKAAKRGSIPARLRLGAVEFERNKHDLAIRHWRLAAEDGVETAMKNLWKSFYRGKLSKDDLEGILRAHKNAIDERSSEDRERCSSFEKAEENNDKMLIALYHEYYSGNITAKELNKALKDFGY